MTFKSINRLNKTLVILPAAGFATRMGSPESKEILINPSTGKTFIQFSLEQAKSIHAEVLLITRSEKKSLINWITQYAEQLNLVLKVKLIEKSKEWPDSILQAYEQWHENNILLLPDTDWKPLDLLQEIDQTLQSNIYEAVYATFKTNQLNWGFFKKLNDLQYLICEKPTEMDKDYSAWGIIGFKKEFGQQIFEMHLNSTFDRLPKILNIKVCNVKLNNFYDRTRNKID